MIVTYQCEGDNFNIYEIVKGFISGILLLDLQSLSTYVLESIFTRMKQFETMN